MTGKQEHIQSLSYLHAVREIASVGGSSVGLCHGCFDIIHAGHVYYLEQAAKCVDILVVSITAADWIDKGIGRPIFDDERRAYLLRALRMVGYVYIEHSATAVPVINALRPDKYFKGAEYAISDDSRIAEERSAVESYGGRIVFTDDAIRDSSSRLVQYLPGELSE